MPVLLEPAATILPYGNLALGGLTVTGDRVTGMLYSGELIEVPYFAMPGATILALNYTPDQTVPEPSTTALVGLGVLAGLWRLRLG